MGRSVAYYRDKIGRMKKRMQNQKRGSAEPKPAAAAAAAAAAGAPSEALIKHLRMVLSQIEGRPVSREEILQLRQRSLGEGGPAADNGARSDEHPP